jgi:hypothetical protein
VAKVKGKATAKSSNVLKDASYKFRAFGGSNDAAMGIINALAGGGSKLGRALKNYFSDVPVSTLEPISFELKSFSDNRLVSTSAVTEQTNEECKNVAKGEVLVDISYEFFLKDSDDGRDDEVYGDFKINGVKPSGWNHTSSKKYKQMKQGTRLLMHKDVCTPIKIDQTSKPDLRELEIKLWDYDSASGNDSVFGRFTKTFDYSKAAKAIEDGKPSYKYEIKARSGNTLFINFYPCSTPESL